MTAADRRRAILEALSSDKFTTRANLAFEFGVSKRTIEYDVVRLSQSYPIYTTKGTGGGIHVMDGYRLDEKYLSEPERSFLERVGGMLSGEDKVLMENIIKKFGLPVKKEGAK